MSYSGPASHLLENLNETDTNMMFAGRGRLDGNWTSTAARSEEHSNWWGIHVSLSLWPKKIISWIPGDSGRIKMENVGTTMRMSLVCVCVPHTQKENLVVSVYNQFAFQNSSIGDLITHSLKWQTYLLRKKTTTEQSYVDTWRYDLTSKKANSKTNG